MQSHSKHLFIDYLRGLASLWVVLFHYKFQIPIPVFQGLIHHGNAGVQIFFVLSGYVIFQSLKRHLKFQLRGAWMFLRKRFFRIYPAFWMSLVLSFAIILIMDHKTPRFVDYFGSATLIYPFIGGKSPQVIYWTLVFEQQFYIFMALLILPVFQKIRMPLIYLSSLIAFGCLIRTIPDTWVFFLLPSHWAEFLLGILVYCILHEENKTPTVLIFVALSIFGLFHSFEMRAAVGSAFLILFLYPRQTLMEKGIFLPLKFLGRISYSLYLLHFPVLNVVQIFTSSRILALAMALILAHLSYKACERPFMNDRADKAVW